MRTISHALFVGGVNFIYWTLIKISKKLKNEVTEDFQIYAIDPSTRRLRGSTGSTKYFSFVCLLCFILFFIVNLVTGWLLLRR